MADNDKWASYLGKALKAMASKFPSSATRSTSRNTDAQNALAESFESPLGQLICEFEEAAVKSILKNFSGTRILILSTLPQKSLSSPSPFRYITRVSERQNNRDSGALVSQSLCVSDFQALPFTNGQFDIVIVQHVLEFSGNPQLALKEAARVTAASGHMAILAFNPLSVAGLASPIVGRLRRNSFWDRRALLAYRLRDWLTFIDFSVVGTEYLCPFLPLNSKRFQRYNRALAVRIRKLGRPLSCVSCIVVRKEVPGMTWLQKPWAVVSGSGSFFSPSATTTANVAGRKRLDINR